jgi:hemolysin III
MFALQNPPDGGSLYTETNLLHIFPEPLNALTSCFFLAIAVYWTFKLWNDHKSHPFLTYCLILLYIGGIGGTTYHAFRKWSPFIMMDWLPIMLLCVSAGVYFLAQLLRWYYAALLVVTYVLFQFLFRHLLMQNGNIQLFLNLNYAMMAALVLLPVFAYLIYTKWKDGKWVGYAFVAFIIALTFRIADKWEWLNSGTHFLWHIFGAIASFCMFNYIYLTGVRKIK